MDPTSFSHPDVDPKRTNTVATKKLTSQPNWCMDLKQLHPSVYVLAHGLQLWLRFIWIRLPACRLWFHWWASSSLFSCYSYFLILIIVLRQTSSWYLNEFHSRLMVNGPTGSQIVGTSSDHLFLSGTLSSAWTPKHSAHICISCHYPLKLIKDDCSL